MEMERVREILDDAANLRIVTVDSNHTSDHNVTSEDEKSTESQNLQKSNSNPKHSNHSNHSNSNHLNHSKQFNVHRLEDQIAILHSEKLRNKSLLICCKPEWVPVPGKPARNFSFPFFVEHKMSDKVVDLLFDKFNADSVSGRQLSRLLTLLVIIYRVKLHKLRTGKSEKPDMETGRIQDEVLHFAVWIIRTFGERAGYQQQSVHIRDDEGQVVEGLYYMYTLNVRKSSFTADLKGWISRYIEADAAVVDMEDDIRNEW